MDVTGAASIAEFEDVNQLEWAGAAGSGAPSSRLGSAMYGTPSRRLLMSRAHVGSGGGMLLPGAETTFREPAVCE